MVSDNTIIDLLNEFIEINIVGINRIMPEYIEQLGLDPMKDAGSDHTDNINIYDGCTATVSYNFSCLKGLRSISISRFEIMSIENGKENRDLLNCPKKLEGSFIVGNVQIDAELGYEIQFNVKGNVEKIECNAISIPLPSELMYSAIIHAKNVKSKNACISLFAHINGKKLALECIKITKFQISHSESFIDHFTLEWKDTSIHIQIPKEKEITKAIIDLLKEKIDPVITPQIQSTVEKQVNDNLPLCVGLDDLRKIIPKNTHDVPQITCP